MANDGENRAMMTESLNHVTDHVTQHGIVGLYDVISCQLDMLYGEPLRVGVYGSRCARKTLLLRTLAQQLRQDTSHLNLRGLNYLISPSHEHRVCTQHTAGLRSIPESTLTHSLHAGLKSLPESTLTQSLPLNMPSLSLNTSFTSDKQNQRTLPDIDPNHILPKSAETKTSVASSTDKDTKTSVSSSTDKDTKTSVSSSTDKDTIQRTNISSVLDIETSLTENTTEGQTFTIPQIKTGTSSTESLARDAASDSYIEAGTSTASISGQRHRRSPDIETALAQHPAGSTSVKERNARNTLPLPDLKTCMSITLENEGFSHSDVTCSTPDKVLHKNGLMTSPTGEIPQREWTDGGKVYHSWEIPKYCLVDIDAGGITDNDVMSDDYDVIILTSDCSVPASVDIEMARLFSSVKNTVFVCTYLDKGVKDSQTNVLEKVSRDLGNNFRNNINQNEMDCDPDINGDNKCDNLESICNDLSDDALGSRRDISDKRSAMGPGGKDDDLEVSVDNMNSRSNDLQSRGGVIRTNPHDLENINNDIERNDDIVKTSSDSDGRGGDIEKCNTDLGERECQGLLQMIHSQYRRSFFRQSLSAMPLYIVSTSRPFHYDFPDLYNVLQKWESRKQLSRAAKLHEATKAALPVWLRRRAYLTTCSIGVQIASVIAIFSGRAMSALLFDSSLLLLRSVIYVSTKSQVSICVQIDVPYSQALPYSQAGLRQLLSLIPCFSYLGSF